MTDTPKHLPPIAGGAADIASSSDHEPAHAKGVSAANAWWFKLVDHLFAPLAIFCLELIMKVSCVGTFAGLNLISLALFSLVAGEIINFCASFTQSWKAKRVIKVALLALVAFAFSVEHFVYREFNVFYDVRTVFSGAGDAVGEFAGEAFRLVISPAGIGIILAFFAPAVLYLVLTNAVRDSSTGRRVKTSLVSAGAGAAAGIACTLLVLGTGSFGRSYTDRYNFQSSVDNFGLLAALARDTHEYFFPTEVSFEIPEEGSTSPDEPEPVKIVPAVMDIDFNALAESSEGRMAELDRYVASLNPSSTNEMTGRFEGYNLIFISAEAFSAEAIRPDTTPTLYRMATKGIQFTDYYQFDSAGTTGGECGNLFGLLPTRGGSSVKGTANHNNYLTIGNQLNRMGYKGWAFHNNTYTYYDRHLSHVNLGYSEGYMGYGNGMEQWVTWQWPQSDLEMVQGTFENLYGNKESEPFNIYYMSVSGHSDYSRGGNAMSQKNWDVVADLEFSEPVKAYLAANVELDRAMEWLIGALEEKGMADHTLIVIGADHFPYGLDNDGPIGDLPYTSELYGYNVTNIFERDHNRLIMWSKSLEDEEPIVVNTPSFALDILPTLSNLMGCEWDSRLLPGRDVFSDAEPLVFNLNYDWKTELGTYFAGSGTFIPAVEGAEIPEGYIEAHNVLVANKINYCRGVLESDYWRHVFGDAS